MRLIRRPCRLFSQIYQSSYLPVRCLPLHLSLYVVYLTTSACPLSASPLPAIYCLPVSCLSVIFLALFWSSSCLPTYLHMHYALLMRTCPRCFSPCIMLFPVWPSPVCIFACSINYSLQQNDINIPGGILAIFSPSSTCSCISAASSCFNFLFHLHFLCLCVLEVVFLFFIVIFFPFPPWGEVAWGVGLLHPPDLLV